MATYFYRMNILKDYWYLSDQLRNDFFVNTMNPENVQSSRAEIYIIVAYDIAAVLSPLLQHSRQISGALLENGTTLAVQACVISMEEYTIRCKGRKEAHFYKNYNTILLGIYMCPIVEWTHAY